MRLIFSLFIFLSPRLIFANNKVGNGGNVVKCPQKETVLLDFYEHDVKPASSIKNAQEIAREKFEALKDFAPELSKQYLKRVEQIFSEINFAKQIEIIDVPDSKRLFKPLNKGCKVIQVAVRNNMAIQDDKRFIIRQDLWDEMTNTQKAGLITHEILHEHFTNLGEETSIKARRVNAYLNGSSVKGDTFWNLIRDLELPIYP